MPKTFVRIHFSFNVFPILKDILVFTQLYEQPFLLYLALLRETPRDGRRDEEIRLNRIWLETRHTPQTLFLYRANRLAFRYRRHLPCSLGREIEPTTTTVYTQPRTRKLIRGRRGHFSFDRSSFAPIFRSARKRSENHYLADSTFRGARSR